MISFIKKVHGKPGQDVSINLLFGVWPPCCATPPSPSSSCLLAHEKYRWPRYMRKLIHGVPLFPNMVWGSGAPLKISVTQRYTPIQRFKCDIIVINDKCLILGFTLISFRPKLSTEYLNAVIKVRGLHAVLELMTVLLLLTSLCKLTFKARKLSAPQLVVTVNCRITVGPELEKKTT